MHSIYYLAIIGIASAAVAELPAPAPIPALARAPELPAVEPERPALGPKACNAQNVLDNCLAVEGQVLAMCSYSDWACKCQAQQAISGCYNNCPSDQGRPAQEGQVTVFCNAAKRVKEDDERSMSKAGKKLVSASASSLWAPDEGEMDEAMAKPTARARKGEKNVHASDTLASFSADSSAASDRSISALAGCAVAWLAWAI
ncbi:hypothetical protein IWW50_005513 [Coemansia erecta]|nr:hypothetical protein GGF43_005041 [Coemansia sp. RSA 2618]KAJ2819273.1 hypothetical protein IWW50_005513 [Coemansia erecta]